MNASEEDSYGVHDTHRTHHGASALPGEGSRRRQLGPCLIEQLDGRSVDIWWGESGDETAALSFEALEAAEEQGHLVVHD
ncbi:MAG: hypothetical protein ABI460_18250 [Caldimonas sp.]